MRTRYFHGWNVVAATFVMALLSFGLGFYGLSVYVATLQRVHGWSASVVSAPVTVYYVAGALLTVVMADLYARFGPRSVVATGGVAMAAGLLLLGRVATPWQLYPAFLVMSVGWGAMSGAAINIILAPWFERRRGLADVGLGPDGDPALPSHRAVPGGEGAQWRRAALRTWRFWSVSAPFALGLAAQVGVLTHLVALVAPVLGTSAAGRAVSAATAAALLGRLGTGFVVDRLSRRGVASATLCIQMVGLALLAWAPSATVVYAGCGLFGLGVGNLTTLPGLVLAVEWPRERFSSSVGLVVGINQFTFAFGPSLVGVVRDAAGGYPAALAVCMGLEALAAGLVLLGPGRVSERAAPLPARTPRG